MNIVHVVTVVDDQASYGGPLTVAINQCRELRARGHDARIMAGWAGSGTPPKELEGVPAHLFRVRPLLPSMRFSALFSASMVSWLWKNARQIDVAHLHAARDLVPLTAGVILQFAGVPYTTQTHGMITPDRRPHARAIDRLLTHRVLRGARRRFVLTTEDEQALVTLIGANETTTRIPNGVAASTHRHNPTQPLDILFMARLHPRKRVLDFARAAQILLHEGIDVRFSVVGPDDGDLEALLAFRAMDPLLTEHLSYEGAIEHDKALSRMARAGIYVLPSVGEFFPMSLLEALALGVPSICTHSCGIAPELQLDGAAEVIEPGAAALSEAIRALVLDADRQTALSAAARETALQRYSMTAVGDLLLSAYQRDEVLL